MHYKTKGKGEKLFVFLHPFPVNSKYFNRMFDNFVYPEGWQIIIPDLPGFGKSPSHPGDILTMKLMAKRVHSLISNMECSKLVLGGVSMGGYIAMEFERLYPDLSSALILSNTSDLADADGGANREKIAEQIMDGGKGDFLINLMNRLLGRTSLTTRKELISEINSMTEKTEAKEIAKAMRGMGKRVSGREWLASFEKPILVITGDEDEITGVDLATEMAKSYKNASLEVIPSTGHYAAMEAPKRYAELITQFLNSLE